MTVLETFISVSFMAILIKLAMGTNHIVGGPNAGWDTSSNLQAWASSQKFSVGDNLIFQYLPNHNVIEVTKANYDSCQPSNPIQSYSDGSTTIPLNSLGKRYFICGALRHCSQGMKVEIDTLAGTTSSVSPTTAPSPADSPVISIVPSPVPESTTSPSESPEYISAAPSPLFETHLDNPSPTFSPIIPSTEIPAAASPIGEHSQDLSAASTKKGILKAFIAIGFSSIMMVLAFKG